MTPRVTALITTCNRPHLVACAVASALAQTVPGIEVLVVVDGGDPETIEVLRSVSDTRLRIHQRHIRGGQAAAINDGVPLVQSPWTAMLDDDDEWLPGKLEAQLKSAESSSYANPIVGCRFVARSERGDALWPLRVPRPREPICEYLFCRTRLAFGEGILPTSMLFAPTELFRGNPMIEDMPRHCDLNWLIRMGQRADVGLEMPPEQVPLAIWNMQGGRDRLSNCHDWRFSYDWITRSLPIVTPRAYAGFLLTWASLSARVQGDGAAFPFLLKEAFRHGRPGLLELIAYAAVWALPLALRARLSHAMTAPGQVS
jgi:glycosyltransferase involved in cell wall biosynthesis